jgi:hypothetical protein
MQDSRWPSTELSLKRVVMMVVITMMMIMVMIIMMMIMVMIIMVDSTLDLILV